MHIEEVTMDLSHSTKTGLVAFLFAIGLASGVEAQGTIDNSAIGQDKFRAHKKTYGLVYRLPSDVTAVLQAKIYGPLKIRLLAQGLKAETKVSNIAHVTVVHIHSADLQTPLKMLKAMPARPSVSNLTLKDFYTTEASKGAGAPWWLDLGIVKTGKGFEDMMSFNTVATTALAPLRDGPLPRCTGPVFANMSDTAKDLVKTVGVSGVNVMKDGKEQRSHNPHNTLVYSMTKFDPKVQASMKDVADEFNKILPNGIETAFKDVSIVEIGFSGNVLREIYRISLENGEVLNVATRKKIKL
jgi:hypothetical protein